jgi:hypothetical protein
MQYWASLILVLAMAAPSEACVFGWFKRPARKVSVQKVVKSAVQKDAVQKTSAVQKSGGSASDICLRKANAQAARGRVFHPGGSFGGARYEGCGSGRTAAAALANCCWSGSKRCVASAVVRGRNGMYFATKLFVD